VLAIHCR